MWEEGPAEIQDKRLPSPVLGSFPASRGLHCGPKKSGLLREGGRRALQARKGHLHHVMAPLRSVGPHRRRLLYLPLHLSPGGTCGPAFGVSHPTVLSGTSRPRGCQGGGKGRRWEGREDDTRSGEMATCGDRDARGRQRALTWRRASEVPAVRVHRLQEEVAHGQDGGGLQPRAPRQAPRCAHARPGPRRHQQGELQPQRQGLHGRRLSAPLAREELERRAEGTPEGGPLARAAPGGPGARPDPDWLVYRAQALRS
jgi:hypothetical protein